MMEFFLAMDPPTTTHQMKAVTVRVGKPRFYEPQGLKAARSAFKAYLIPHRPTAPLTGPLRLVTKWCYPPGRNPAPSYKPTRPDTDNLVKLFKDVMTDVGFWHDDAQVASEVTEKFWAQPPGIYVQVEELGQTTGRASSAAGTGKRTRTKADDAHASTTTTVGRPTSTRTRLSRLRRTAGADTHGDEALKRARDGRRKT